MNRIISYCISVILIIGGASCDFQAVQSDNYPPPLYKPPPAYLFNPEGGYDFNPLLNKPITPVINPSNNDTIETGTPFLLRAERYSLDSIKIDTLPALPIKDWEVISARTNKYPAKWIKSGKSIVFDSLKSFDITETHSDFTIRKYQSQDIVPSGKAIPISPEKVSLPLSEPVINPITNSISNGSQNFKSTGTPTEYESSSNRSITLDKYSNIWVTKNGYTYHCISQNHIITYKNRGGFWGWQNVLNDSKGNIWSTKTKELLCYNGETFTSYPFPGIRVIINIIIEDKHGNLWIGMNGLGLGKFDGQSLTYYTTKEGLSGNYVYSISEDNKGRLWIGTNNGISIFDHQKFYHINEENGLIAKHILSVFADNDSSIWFASYEKGIHQLKGNNLYTIKLNKLEHKSVWVNTFESYLSTQSSPHIVKDKKNNIWVASKYGLCKISENRENIEVFSTKDGLNSNFIQDIAQDSHGNFITAQQYGGLSIRPVNSIVHYSNNIDIENTWIDGLFEDHQGRIWQAADEQQSIIVMENDTLYRNANLAKQFGILTMAFEEDKNGDIWMGGEGGIMRYDGKYAYSYNLGFTSGRYVWNIRCLDSGNILITGLMGGYLLYDGSGFKHYFADSNPRLLITSSSAEDPEGKIWLDSRPNNLLLDGDSVTFYSEKEGFFWVGSRENLIDQSGNRWFAGRYGVQVLSGDSIYFIGQEQGLYQNEYDMHYEIVEDRNGNIWLISGSVITCFITQKESSSFEIENIITLTRWNGMKGNWATTSSFMIDRENKLWVGTEKGSSYLDLNEVNLTPAEVKPQLISLDINSQFLDYRNMYNSLRKDIQFSEMIPFANVPKDLELNYRQNHLTFFYDANDWAAADMIRFSYRLKGEEENWSEPTPETMVDYRNLSHGTYTFQLCAIGQGREWSAPLEYTFTVLPPLWLTWYAWGSYILLILLGLYQYRSYLLRNATRKADARLKLMEADKIRELDEHKTHFFTNITHEFRTPLSLISGTIQSLKKPGIPLEERETNIDLLSRNSQRLTKLVNNLLELTKLEESRMKVELKKCDLISEIKYHMAAFQSVAQSRNITFKISAPEEQVIAYSDTEKLEIILYNLLSNAFKYVDEYGKIGLEVKTGNAHNLEIKSGNSGYQGEYISIAVNDDGPGIAPDKLEKIFDRFEKDLSAVQYSEGMGIGLALAKELVQFLNGSIEVKSKVNEGTTVLVYIPIEKEGFDNVSSIDEEVIERDADLTETVDTDGIEKEQESLLTTGQKIVLIAEDNEDLRTYLRQELTSDFKLLMTENGRIAWDQCLEYLPDLIITDLMMPEMDGIELCKKVKEHELTSHIPVIMLTAKSGSENRIEGHKSGADDYIQKPFNIEELRIKMQNMILQREKLKEKFSINSIFTETDSSGENVNAEFLRRLSETLEENLTNTQLTPEFLAENMNMSRSQLYRKHKAVTGESVSAFIRDYRLSRAEQLLRHNSANVTEVAYMCGFQTPSYFTTAFSKRYGVSPLSYLKKYNS